MSNENTKGGKKKVIIIAVIIAITAALAFGVYSYINNYASFEPEEFDKAALVVSDNTIHLSTKTVRLPTPSKANKILDVYCVDRGRVYYCYGVDNIWNIASTDMEGKTIKAYYKYENAGIYQHLSSLSDYSDAYGGLYRDGCIYIKGQEGILIFDLKAETMTQAEEMPKLDYAWKLENGKASFGKKGELKSITLNDIAQKNYAASELAKLCSSDEFITGVSAVDGNYYITGQLTGKFGMNYAVLFRYEPETDTYKYLNTSITKTDAFPIPIISYFGRG